MLTMLATDAVESVDDFGNWAIGRNFALSPGERLAVAANAGSEAPVVPSPIAVATAAIPAALVKRFLGLVEFFCGREAVEWQTADISFPPPPRHRGGSRVTQSTAQYGGDKTSWASRCGIVATLRRHSPLRNCSGVWIDFPELPREGDGTNTFFATRPQIAASGHRINNSAAACE